MIDLARVCISDRSTLRDVMVCIDRNSVGIALVVDAERRLLFTITDGDMRRAILYGLNLDLTVTAWANQKPEQGNKKPLVMPLGTPMAELLRLMQTEDVRHIPLVDEVGRVGDLALLRDLIDNEYLGISAVVMAGGLGIRLRPLTEEVPKPMLPVGGRPLMERIIGQLRQVGIQRVNVATHYQAGKIVDYFGDGHAFGVELNYVNEDRPLGTAGALGLIEAPKETLLVMNGDILTDVNFRAMLDYHRENRAEMTVGVRRYEMQIPYGVIECEGSRVRRLQEKPHVGFLVNAGIYLLEPSVYNYISQGRSFNMTDLIQWLLEAGRNVVSFPIREYWLDIGQHTDYVQAQEDVKKVGGNTV